MTNPKSFFVTLLSNACTNDFKENTLASFTNKLPQSLNFENLHEWRVAIHSLGVSSKFEIYNKFNEETVPDFRVLIRVRDYQNAKYTYFFKNLEYYSHYEGGSYSTLNEEHYDEKFLESIRRQPLKFMEALSHDHNIFDSDLDTLLHTYRNIFTPENKYVEGLGKNDGIIRDGLDDYKTIWSYTLSGYQIDINLGKEHLTPEQILTKFAIWQKIGVPLKVELNKKGYFTISTVETENNIFGMYGFSLLIHHSTAEKFTLPTNALRKTKVCGVEYFCKDFNNVNDLLVGQSKNWVHDFPDVIDIQCGLVKEEIHNSLLEKRVALVCPSFHNREVYHTYVADLHNFCPVSNNYLNQITVKLKDLQTNNLLNLLPGPATYIKFLFKKMDASESFNVRLSNNTNSFETFLPQPINLDQSWKCTLSSMSFPTEFLPLPIDRLKRKIWYVDNGIVRAGTLPNIQYSKSLLVQVINHFFLNSGVSFTVENDKFLVSSTKSLNFGFSQSVAHILGFDSDFNSDLYPSQNFEYVHINEHVGIQLKNSYNTNTPLFYRTVNMEYLRPCYLMVYANIIDHSVVGSQYIKLLRIVPIHRQNGYDLHEFKQAEYHGLEFTYFDSIKIEIRDHAGELVNFINKKVSLNIRFSRNESDSD